MFPIGLAELQASADAYQSRYKSAKETLPEYESKFGTAHNQDEYLKLKNLDTSQFTPNDKWNYKDYLWFLTERTSRSVGKKKNEAAEEIKRFNFKKLFTKQYYRDNTQQTWKGFKQSLLYGVSGTAITTLTSSLYNNIPLLETIEKQTAFVVASGFLVAGLHRNHRKNKEAEEKIGFGFKFDFLDKAYNTALNRSISIPTTTIAAITGYISIAILMEGSLSTDFQQAVENNKEHSNLINNFETGFKSIAYPVFGAVNGAMYATIATVAAPLTVIPAIHSTVGLTKDFAVSIIGKTLQHVEAKQQKTHQKLNL
jgi:hypothetical protein